VQATEVGGTHPALIEAMARAAPVLYLNTPENLEVAGDAAVAFDASPEDLAQKLQWMIDLPAEQRAVWGRRAMERVRSRYSWEVVTAQYETLLRQLIKRT
jgi:glycosyltransferase involved in cell wall biosynthesis